MIRVLKKSTLLDASKLKITRTKEDRERKIYGNVTYSDKIVWNNSVTVEGKLYHKTANEYRLTPYKIKTNFCDGFTEDIYVYPELTNYSSYPNPFECPLQSVSARLRLR